MIISIAKEESLDFKHIGSETHRVTLKKIVNTFGN